MSLKIRFEVFKRDGFKCQYCGRTPPDVILELDHVIPKSAGGSNDINNYVTACFGCNRGKGKRNLKKIPASLQKNIELIKEKEAQIIAYNRLLRAVEKRINRSIVNIYQHIYDIGASESLNNFFDIPNLKNFLKKLTEVEVIDAIDIAWSHFCRGEYYDSSRFFRYFCGVCWQKIRKKDAQPNN